MKTPDENSILEGSYLDPFFSDLYLDVEGSPDFSLLPEQSESPHSFF